MPHPSHREETRRAIEETVPRLMLDAKIPGLSLALIEDARVAWSRGFGVKSAITREPVTVETIYEAASLSKPVAAWTALQLCDQGRLDLDTCLGDYLPEPYYWNDARTQEITTRHVLTHTTGLPNGLPNLIERMIEKRYIDDGSSTLTHFAPGTRYAYSGEGFYYLQLVIEQVTGQPFDQHVRREILAPLGMENSSYVWLDRYGDLIADRHNEHGMPDRPENWASLRAHPIAGASLFTTPTEYARFMCALLESAAEKPHSLAGDMFRSQVRITDGIWWSLGWGKQHAAGVDSFWHPGHGLFTTFAMGQQAGGLGLVMMANGHDDTVAEGVFHEVVRMHLGGSHPAFEFVADDFMLRSGYLIRHKS